MSDASQAKKPSYAAVFGALLVALVVSLFMGVGTPTPLVTAGIFVIAAAKALLVVMYFMHLAVEPRWIKVVVIGTLAVLACLYVGLVLDVAEQGAVIVVAKGAAAS